MSKISELSDGGSLVSSDYLIAVRSGGNVKVRMDQINVDQIDLGDNEFIRLGNSQDLTIVHAATQSIINQAGIGDLLIQKAGSTKLTVNSSGIDVTGTVTADGLTVDGAFSFSTSVDGVINSPAALYLNFDSDNNSAGEAFVIGSNRASGSGGNEHFRVTASGNVGIGTSNPTKPLHVESSVTNTNTVLVKNTAGTGVNYGLEIAAGTNATDHALHVTSSSGTSLLRVDGSGSVGIGTSSPAAKVNIDMAEVGDNGASSATRNLLLAQTSSTQATAGTLKIDGFIHPSVYRINIDSSTGAGAAAPLSFSTANGATETMRIDSSGNLLVGTTDSTPYDNSANSTADNGIVAGAGLFAAARYQGSVGLFNRTGNDGEILGFKRSGAAVGSIGTLNANRIYFGGADTGIMIASDLDCIYPTNGGDTARDNAVHLGNSGTRFKDLYLSGASLAGAGSASSPSISFSGDTNTGLYSGGADNINFATGGTARAFMSATQFNMTGNGVFSGSISKGSGSFKIDHPLPEKTKTHHLVHSFVESPQADNIYRGKVDLVDGLAAVNIDSAAGMTEGTYVLLNTNTQCFTSNESGWTAVKGSVSGNTLTITAQDNTCTDTISWMVVGERHDQHMLDTEWTDENGRVIVEPLKES